MTTITTRRNLLLGLTGIVAAPAIVRASSLMKVRPLSDLEYNYYWMSPSGFYTNGLVPLSYKFIPDQLLCELTVVRDQAEKLLYSTAIKDGSGLFEVPSDSTIVGFVIKPANKSEFTFGAARCQSITLPE